MANPYIPETVLITGATGGFGQAFARAFAALGSRLILHGRSLEKLRDLERDLTTPHLSLGFDLRDTGATARAIKNLPPAWQTIDLLINNAGGALGLDAAQTSDLDDWDTMVDVNVRGLLQMTRLVLPGMIARGRGHIINIGSTAGTYPYPGGHVYCATKAFVAQFSLALRADLAGTKVRVTTLEPGMVETDFSLRRFKGDTARAAAVYADTTPLQADDIADLAAFIATRPPHVNINRLEVMPTAQSFAPLAVERQTAT
jgi:3-hydroxy acid dehydrogenase / malonic semialdehyde reductase